MSIIPSQAKKIFEGVIFDVYQRQQDLYDGTTKTFEIAKRPDGSRTIATKDGKVLITKQQQPDTNQEYYVFPGGRLNPNETPQQGAKRELQEETGLVSKDFLYYASYGRMHKVEYQAHVFIARHCRFDTKQQLDGGEKVKLVWLRFEELMEIIFSKHYGFSPFANHLFRLERKGKLNDFRNVLKI